MTNLTAYIQDESAGILWQRPLRSPEDARVAAERAVQFERPVALTLEGLDRLPSWERVYDSTNAENLGASGPDEIERRIRAFMEGESDG